VADVIRRRHGAVPSVGQALREAKLEGAGS
jgi:hypothetical protein